MMSVSRALLKASLISGVLRRLEWKVSRDGAWGAGLWGRVGVSLGSGRVRVRIRGLWSERKSEPAVFVGRIVQRETRFADGCAVEAHLPTVGHLVNLVEPRRST
jgi:hypothetical protein